MDFLNQYQSVWLTESDKHLLHSERNYRIQVIDWLSDFKENGLDILMNKPLKSGTSVLSYFLANKFELSYLLFEIPTDFWLKDFCEQIKKLHTDNHYVFFGNYCLLHLVYCVNYERWVKSNVLSDKQLFYTVSEILNGLLSFFKEEFSKINGKMFLYNSIYDVNTYLTETHYHGMDGSNNELVKFWHDIWSFYLTDLSSHLDMKDYYLYFLNDKVSENNKNNFGLSHLIECEPLGLKETGSSCFDNMNVLDLIRSLMGIKAHYPDDYEGILYIINKNLSKDKHLFEQTIGEHYIDLSFLIEYDKNTRDLFYDVISDLFVRTNILNQYLEAKSHYNEIMEDYYQTYLRKVLLDTHWRGFDLTDVIFKTKIMMKFKNTVANDIYAFSDALDTLYADLADLLKDCHSLDDFNDNLLYKLFGHLPLINLFSNYQASFYRGEVKKSFDLKMLKVLLLNPNQRIVFETQYLKFYQYGFNSIWEERYYFEMGKDAYFGLWAYLKYLKSYHKSQNVLENHYDYFYDINWAYHIDSKYYDDFLLHLGNQIHDRLSLQIQKQIDNKKKEGLFGFLTNWMKEAELVKKELSVEILLKEKRYLIDYYDNRWLITRFNELFIDKNYSLVNKVLYHQDVNIEDFLRLEQIEHFKRLAYLCFIYDDVMANKNNLNLLVLFLKENKTYIKALLIEIREILLKKEMLSYVHFEHHNDEYVKIKSKQKNMKFIMDYLLINHI